MESETVFIEDRKRGLLLSFCWSHFCWLSDGEISVPVVWMSGSVPFLHQLANHLLSPLWQQFILPQKNKPWAIVSNCCISGDHSVNGRIFLFTEWSWYILLVKLGVCFIGMFFFFSFSGSWSILDKVWVFDKY